MYNVQKLKKKEEESEEEKGIGKRKETKEDK